MKRWIWIVVALLATNMLATIALLVTAGDPSARIVPHAYQRAIEFDRTLAALEASDELGWRANARLSAIDGARDRVEIELTDGAGAALHGAQVEVSVRHASHATGAATVLTEQRPGHYAGEVAAQGRGLHAIDILARRADDHFAAARSVTLIETAP